MAEQTVLVPAQGDQPQIVKLGTVAAQNIALTLNLAETHVSTIESAISDEINAMSAHFTLAFADVQTAFEVEKAKLKTQFEKEVTEIKSGFKFIRENNRLILAYTALIAVIGFAVGVLV